MSTLRDLPLTPFPDRSSEDIFRDVFELHAFGLAMKRQQFRREHPAWSEDQVEAAMQTWMRADPLPCQLEPGFRVVEGATWTARSSTR